MPENRTKTTPALTGVRLPPGALVRRHNALNVANKTDGRLTVAAVSRVRQMPDLKDYMTTEEAARVLKLHVETIREFLRDGTLDGLKVGRSWVVLRKSVATYREATAGMAKNDPRRGD